MKKLCEWQWLFLQAHLNNNAYWWTVSTLNKCGYTSLISSGSIMSLKKNIIVLWIWELLTLSRQTVFKTCNPPNMSFHSPCFIRGDLREEEKAINQSTCLHAKTKYQSLISVYPRAQIEAILTENASMLRLCSWCISPRCQNRFGAGGKIVERRVKKRKWSNLADT